MQDNGRLRYEFLHSGLGGGWKGWGWGGFGVGNPLTLLEAIIIGAALENRTRTRMQKNHTTLHVTMHSLKLLLHFM